MATPLSEKRWVRADWRAHSFLLLWAGFAALTLWAVLAGLDRADERPALVVATTVGTLLGPLSGAISREGQSCCVAFSLSLLPYCVAAVVVGVMAEFIAPAESRLSASVRVLAWIGGWLVWFGGGILSLGHALS
ncbi:MAG: hypothetical protein AAFV43_02190 [Planctomycetota bacterium]